MADTAYDFAVTCPAGTAIANPQVSNINVPAGIVSNIKARVPDGPRGNMGFALGLAGQSIIPGQVVPATALNELFIIANDATFEFGSQGDITSGAWQAFMFNMGQYAHTVYVTIFVAPIRGIIGGAPPVALSLSGEAV